MYAENKPPEKHKPKIYLSPSQDSSGRCILGDDEKAHCNQYIDHLTEYLDACGILWKRSSGNLAQAVTESKQWKPDIHYAVHTGAYNGLTRYSAFYVHSAESASAAYLCAEQLKKARAEIYRRPIYVTQNRELYEMMKVSAPCVYDRIAFHDNLEDAQFLHKNLRNLARSAAVGFAAYFNVPFKEPGDLTDKAVFVSGATEELQIKAETEVNVQAANAGVYGVPYVSPQLIQKPEEISAPQPMEAPIVYEAEAEKEPCSDAPEELLPQMQEPPIENELSPAVSSGVSKRIFDFESAPRGAESNRKFIENTDVFFPEFSENELIINQEFPPVPNKLPPIPMNTELSGTFIENAYEPAAYDWAPEEYAQCEPCREKPPVPKVQINPESMAEKKENAQYGTFVGCENVMRLYEAEAEAHRATRKEYSELIKKFNEMRSKNPNTEC